MNERACEVATVGRAPLGSNPVHRDCTAVTTAAAGWLASVSLHAGSPIWPCWFGVWPEPGSVTAR